MEKLLDRLCFAESVKATAEGLLRGVHLVGLKSSNRVKGQKEPYVYQESAIRDAAKMYESVEVHVDHKEGERSLTTKIGFVAAGSTVYKEGKGLFGDVQLNTKHPLYESVIWWSENAPNKLGMSHVASVEYDKATNAVTRIDAVHTVDLVSNPSTTKALFHEGIISDKILQDKETDHLRSIVGTFVQLCWEAVYPLEKQLTPAEKAVKLRSLVEDAGKELSAIIDGKPTKESTMEWTDVTIDAIKKNKPELFSQIAEATLAAQNELDTKVQEAVKEVPEVARSKVFLSLVREHIRSGRDVVDLVADRKLIASAKVEAIPAVGTRRASESTSAIPSDDELLKHIKVKG